jgi:autotransporter-associated beta strand protein
MKPQSNPFLRPARFVAALTLTTCLPVTFAVLTLCASTAYGQNGSRTWTGAVDGNYYNGANWSPSGDFPNGNAIFSGTTANSTITKTGNAYEYIFGLIFSNTLGTQSSFTFSPGGTRFFVGGSSISTAAVTSGRLTDEIGVNVYLSNAATAFDMGSNHDLKISGNITAGATTVTKNGAGTLILSGTNTYTATTTAAAGTLLATRAVSLSGYNSAGKVIFNGGTIGAQLGGSGWTTTEVDTLLANATKTSGALAIDTTHENLTQWTPFTASSFGALGLTKLGTNTFTLGQANTYTGSTTIAAGILQADGADGVGTGALGNGGTIRFTGGTLQYTANSAGTNYSARILNNTTAAIKLDTNGQNVTFGTALSSTNTAGLTKEGAGQLELKMGAASYTGTTTINGGTLKFAGTADLDYLSSSSININHGASLVIYSDFNRTTLSNGKTFTFGSSGGGSIVYDKGNHLWQSSTGKFVTTGGTQNTISGANGGFINPQNTNTVNFEVADGTDAVDLLVSVGIGSGNYTKSGAGTLLITSFSTLGGGAAQPNLTINAGTFDVGGAARLTTVGQSTGVVTSDILNNGVYRHSSSNPQTLAGIMSGNGALTQNGSGTLTLSGANTFTGQTTISTGVLQIGAGSTTGRLSASSAIVNNSNLTINRSDAVTQGTDFSSAAITGTGSLTAAGAGTTTLNAANSYSGATTVNAGADLRINGAQTGVGTVTVAATGKLGGSGSVIGGINVSGILAPGNSIESLGGGALNFNSGSTYAYELSTLGLDGDLTHSSGTLGIASGTILTLTDLSASTALANGSKLTLISSVGAWNGGLFSYNAGAGLVTLSDDSDITLGANVWRFNYNDTSAGSNFISDTTGATNFVTLTAIPEPSVAGLLGGLGALLFYRSRRSRNPLDVS